MTKITLSSAEWSEIQSAGQVVFCNSDGQALGVFRLVEIAELPLGEAPGITDEERDAVRRWEGRCLKDIFADLEKMS